MKAIFFSAKYDRNSLFIMIEDSITPNKVWVYHISKEAFIYVRENGTWWYIEGGLKIEIIGDVIKRFDYAWKVLCSVE